MKKFVFGIVAIVLFNNLSFGQNNEIVYSNCSLRTEQSVGYIDNKGDFVISIDSKKLLEDFSIIAKESGLDIEYERVEILRANSDEKLNLFGLYAVSKDGFTKTAIDLDLKNETFIISSKGATITCSSTNCTESQCMPYDNGSVWTCTSCIKNCSKTATVVLKSFDSTTE